MDAHTCTRGYRADWENGGMRLALYAPPCDGYRLLTAWCELVSYVPAWGTRADTVTEWQAYRHDTAHRAIRMDSRSVESFQSPGDIVAWLESLGRSY